jgi:hypothetical protein
VKKVQKQVDAAEEKINQLLIISAPEVSGFAFETSTSR